MKPDPCIHMLNFDVAVTSGLYSQLAGVLAGFAFGVLVIVLTSQAAADQSPMADDRITHVLTSCLLGLILVSLTYGVLAGETTNAGRAAMVELVAAPGFIAAGMLLLLSIYMLLGAAEKPTRSTATFRGTTPMVRFVLAHVTPVILTASLLGGVDDYSDARWGNHQFRTVDVVLTVAGALIILVPIATRCSWLRLPTSTRLWSSRGLASAAVGIAALAAVGTYLTSALLDECQTLGQWFVSLVVVVPVFYMLLLSTYLIKDPEKSTTQLG